MSAVSWMKKMSGTRFPGRTGFCLGTVRRAFNAPGMANARPAGGTARMAWDRCPPGRRRPFNGKWNEVPANRAFIYAGGSRGYGHIVVTAGNGWALGTDPPGRRARIGLHRLSMPVTSWGMRPLGTVDILNGKEIFRPAPAKKVASKKAAAPAARPVITLYRQAHNPAAYLGLGTRLRWHVPGPIADAWRQHATIDTRTLRLDDPFWKRTAL